MSTLGDTLEGLVAKLREQAHEAESPYGTKTPEEPDWDYVAKAFREIADELAAALAAEGRQRVVDAIVKGNVETLLAMQAAAPSLHKEPPAAPCCEHMPVEHFVAPDGWIVCNRCTCVRKPAALHKEGAGGRAKRD